MLFESNTIGSDSIEVRRLDMGVAHSGQAIASPLICGYEEYIHRSDGSIDLVIGLAPGFRSGQFD
jgi:hypothetical protein